MVNLFSLPNYISESEGFALSRTQVEVPNELISKSLMQPKQAQPATTNI